MTLRFEAKDKLKVSDLQNANILICTQDFFNIHISACKDLLQVLVYKC